MRKRKNRKKILLSVRFFFPLVCFCLNKPNTKTKFQNTFQSFLESQSISISKNQHLEKWKGCEGWSSRCEMGWDGISNGKKWKWSFLEQWPCRFEPQLCSKKENIIPSVYPGFNAVKCRDTSFLMVIQNGWETKEQKHFRHGNSPISNPTPWPSLSIETESTHCRDEYWKKSFETNDTAVPLCFGCVVVIPLH